MTMRTLTPTQFVIPGNERLRIERKFPADNGWVVRRDDDLYLHRGALPWRSENPTAPVEKCGRFDRYDGSWCHFTFAEALMVTGTTL